MARFEVRLDEHGWPDDDLFSLAAVIHHRGFGNLPDLCRKILRRDGLKFPEAPEYLDFLERFSPVSSSWPFQVCLARLYETLRAGGPDRREAAALAFLLKNARQGADYLDQAAAGRLGIPLDRPPLLFERKEYCAAGCFCFGDHEAVLDLVLRMGGWTEEKITAETSYVIVGALGIDHWRDKPQGRRLLRAAELANKHPDLKLIHEQYFLETLLAGTRVQ